MERYDICIKAWEVNVPLDTCMTNTHMADVLDWRHAQMGSGYRTLRTPDGEPTIRAVLASIAAMPVIWMANPFSDSDEEGEVITQAESWRRFDAHMDGVLAAHGIEIGQMAHDPEAHHEGAVA